MNICQDASAGRVCGHANRDGALFCARCGKPLRVRKRGEIIGGRYRLVREIGRGGFGAVYEAEDLQWARARVALKETFDPAHIAQYRAEFAVLSRLRHDHLPRYHHVFEDETSGYLVMEYVPGQSLQEVIEKKRGPLLEAQVLGAYGLQLCDALIHLHSQSPPVVHRDIKPANVRLTPEGLVKLVDFGLVKEMSTGAAGGAAGASTGLGTPAYAPPEQWGMGGWRTGPHSDIYSLGATLYHLLTGQEPPSAVERASGGPVLVRPAQVNRALRTAVSDVVVKAMAMEPSARFRDVETLKTALLTAANAPPPSVSTPKSVPPLSRPHTPRPAPPAPAARAAPPAPAPTSAGRKGMLLVLLIAGALIVGLFAALGSALVSLPPAAVPAPAWAPTNATTPAQAAEPSPAPTAQGLVYADVVAQHRALPADEQSGYRAALLGTHIEWTGVVHEIDAATVTVDLELPGSTDIAVLRDVPPVALRTLHTGDFVEFRGDIEQVEPGASALRLRVSTETLRRARVHEMLD